MPESTPIKMQRFLHDASTRKPTKSLKMFSDDIKIDSKFASDSKRDALDFMKTIANFKSGTLGQRAKFIT